MGIVSPEFPLVHIGRGRCMPARGEVSGKLDRGGRAYLARRLGWYWQMERACALLFPPLAFGLARPATLLAAAGLALSLVACCSILWIGATYWRAVWARMEYGRSSMAAALAMAARWEPSCLAATVASVAACAVAIGSLGPSRATFAAAGFSILAVLEYINYYRIQLQNFDHGPTFRRFLARRAFPRAHLAKDLAIFRKSRSKGTG